MRNKKLYAALLVGTMVVGMMGSTVMAADPTGNTNFTYNSGTITPPDPVDPVNPDADANNWAITYDRNIILADSNVGEDAAGVKTNGAQISFTVKQKVAGSDGDYQITDAQVGQYGLDIKASATNWASGTAIEMTNSTATNPVKMQLANGESVNSTPSLLNPNGVIVNLNADNLDSTIGAGSDSDKGWAALTSDSKAVDGTTYTQTVTWTVARATQ